MSRRRRVLQLDSDKSTPRKIVRPAAAPIRGLVSQYEDTDSEGEEKAPTPPPPQPQQEPAKNVNGNTDKGEGKDIDYQVANFLAEIEAIDEQPSPPGAPPEPEVKVSEAQVKIEESFTKNAETLPSRSSSKGFVSGGVTKGMKFVSGGTTHDPDKRFITDSGSSKGKEVLEEPERPVTRWQHCYDENSGHYYYWDTATNDVRWEIPEDYQQFLLKNKAYEEAMAVFEAKKAALGDKAIIKKKAKKEVKEENCTPVSTAPAPPVKEEYPVKDTVPAQPIKTEETKNVSAPLIGPVKPEPEPIPDQEQIHTSTMIGPQLPNQELELPEKVHGPSTCSSRSSQNEDLDDDEIHKQLEEPVVNQYEQLIKQNNLDVAPPPPPPEKMEEEKSGSDMDEIEDIDKQLDMALEKKQAKSKRDPEGKKRPVSFEDEDIPTTKLRKISPEESPRADEEAVNYIKKKLIKNKEEFKMKTEIADLATLVTDKLDFLEVTRKGLSKLQVLLIEIQTRIRDWRAGGLDTKYLLGKLREASELLQAYEKSAAPPGWSCHWDRTYKRYFYYHDTRGETSWEYPEDDEEDDLPKEECAAPCPLPKEPQAPVVPQKLPPAPPVPQPPEAETMVSSTTVPKVVSQTETSENDSDKIPDEKTDEPLPPGTGPPLPLPPASEPTPPPLPPLPSSPSSNDDMDTGSSDEEKPEVLTSTGPFYLAAPPPPPPPEEDAVDIPLFEKDNSTISAPPVLRVPPGAVSNEDSQSPAPLPAPSDAMATEAEASSATVTPVPSPPHPGMTEEAPAQTAQPPATIKEKKKKKEKSKKTASSLSMKKRNFPSLVQKWQHAQEDMEAELQKRKQAEKEAEKYAERMAEKWKQEQREGRSDS